MTRFSSTRVVLIIWAVACGTAGWAQAQIPDPRPPETPVKLVFIHHSCGENWLSDPGGGLARALGRNNYFVSDTNYGWGPDGIGDRTDIPNWPEWFNGPHSPRYLTALYHERERRADYIRPIADPGGENQVVMFKSCFPNSNLAGRPTDRAARGDGLTVSNAKAIYRDLLAYFATRPDKLFVAITAPPVQDPAYSVNARAFNTWLVRDWLTDYRGGNVAVFDFYNLLTGPGNHHRFRNGRIEYVTNPRQNTLHYASNGDDHPSRAGNRKATEEFVPLLNVYYRRWLATAPRPSRPGQPRVEIALTAEPVLPVLLPAPPVAIALAPPSPPPVVLIETPSHPAPAATGPAAHGPAGPHPLQAVETFDGNVDHWQAIFEEATGTSLAFQRDSQLRHNGAGSLQIRYDVTPGSWATCSLIHQQPHNWSAFRGLSLFVHAETVGQPITIVVYGGTSPDDLLHFEYHFTASQAAVSGWQRVTIGWDELRLPEWQATATNRLDPSAVMGVALGFHAPEGERNTGRVWIDDVEVW